MCVSVCADRRGGVGIVCHQMNSWGETNEECREKEGGILIGLSLCLTPLSSQREHETERWLCRGTKGFLTLLLQTSCSANCSITFGVTYFVAKLGISCF